MLFLSKPMVLKCALKILESGSIRAIRPLEPGGGGAVILPPLSIESSTNRAKIFISAGTGNRSHFFGPIGKYISLKLTNIPCPKYSNAESNQIFDLQFCHQSIPSGGLSKKVKNIFEFCLDFPSYSDFLKSPEGM